MAGTESARLLAGFASVDISPTRPVSLWGQMHRRVSTAVHDPITATALALQGPPPGGVAAPGLDQAILVSCDLCGIDARLQRALRERLREHRPPGLEPEAVLLCATHTHTAPYTSEDQSFMSQFGPFAPPNPMQEDPIDPRWYERPAEYAETLLRLLLEVVARAWERREPALLGRALERARVGHNRRVVYRDGSAVMYGSSSRADFARLEGGSDDGIELLCFWPESGGGPPLGVVANVACPSQILEARSYVSADYWGAARRETRERIGPEVALLGLCGAAGDQSPRDLVRRARGEPSMYDEEGVVEIGARVAASVERALEGSRSRALPAQPLAHLVRTLELPLRRVTDAEAAAARREHDALLGEIGPTRPIAGSDLHRLFPSIGVMLRHAEQRERDGVETEVHAIRLGASAIASNPFELYLDYGLRLKARSPAEQTLVVQLAGAFLGYLPTQIAVEGGGYGGIVACGCVDPGGGDLLVEETLGMLASLWAAPSGSA